MKGRFEVVPFRRQLAIGPTIIEYRVEGDLRGIGLIPRAYLLYSKRDCQSFQLGGYKFVVIEIDYLADSYVVMLARPYAYIARAFVPIRHAVEIIKFRLMLTAYVWGLMDYEQNWRNPMRKGSRRE